LYRARPGVRPRSLPDAPPLSQPTVNSISAQRPPPSLAHFLRLDLIRVSRSSGLVGDCCATPLTVSTNLPSLDSPRSIFIPSRVPLEDRLRHIPSKSFISCQSKRHPIQHP
jgi:hypothetical protein